MPRMHPPVTRRAARLYRKEAGALLRLFWPIILGQLAVASTGMVDTLMAGMSGTTELAGVAVGAAFFFPILFAVIGYALALQPITAQLCGGGCPERIPPRFQTGLVVCLGVSVALGGVLCLAPQLFGFLDADPAMLRVAAGYIYAVAASFPASAFYNALRAYSEGLGLTVPTLIFGCVMLALNIPLNYVFIFGWGPIPAYGGIGCGIATTVMMYLTAGGFWLYVRRAAAYAGVRVLTARYPLSWDDVRKFMRLGTPLALSATLEMTCFACAAVVLSVFGPVVVSGHTVALNISGMLFMLPLSLGMAASIRTGMAIGARDWERSARIAKTVYAIGMTCCLVGLVFLWQSRRLLVSCYTDDPAVIELGSQLLLLCCGYLIPDTLQMMGMGVARGFKDTRTIFVVTVTAYWLVGIPLGVGLARGWYGGAPLQAHGIWIGFTAGLSVAALCYLLRLRHLFATRSLPASMRADL